MSPLTLYRRRLIPDECILRKDDEIVRQNDSLIVTKWNTLNPKAQFQYGASCYFLKEGFKVSKFYRSDGSLFCWYCDIMQYDFDAAANTLMATDLLADVIILPDGTVKVVDLDELTDAFEQGVLSAAALKAALRQLNHLLSLIYENQFHLLQNELDSLGL